MGNKNITVEVVRGIAIILVVYGHVIQRTMGPNGADFFLNPAFRLIYTFHMPLFVFISGYLMAYSLSRRSIADAFKSRCKSLLVPFLSWSLLGVITNYVLNAVDGKPLDINLARDLMGQLVLNPVIWFLFTLFVLSAMLLSSVKLQERFGAAVFAAVYLIVLLIPYNDYCALYYIKWFYPFYAAGYLINRYNVRIDNNTVRNVSVLAALAVFLVLVSQWIPNDYIYINKMKFASDQYLAEISRVIYRYAAGFLGIFIVFYAGAQLAKTRVASALGYIGIYSLDIYLLQRYLVEGLYPRIVSSAYINFDFNSPLFLGVYVPLLVAFFTGSCILISRFLIRKSPLLGALLLGNRV